MSASLVLGSRDVSVGPAAAAVGDRGGVGDQRVAVSSLLKKNLCFVRKSFDFDEESDEEEEEISSQESELEVSENEDDEKVETKLKGALSSMNSLEESLPIKRGLSNFFNGKSKSFANFSQVSSISDLAKPDNPFNKRRRTLIARSRAIRPIKSSLCFASVLTLFSPTKTTTTTTTTTIISNVVVVVVVDQER
ncbi:hypothetical protein Syun_024859 [Stephania yunnanensis]|uniref:Uncharacterized protein n=1 Tax=Stephania yunnanensis TaxID=152371 RepID=A0AAP0HU69_9MAGN